MSAGEAVQGQKRSQMTAGARQEKEAEDRGPAHQAGLFRISFEENLKIFIF